MRRGLCNRAAKARNARGMRADASGAHRRRDRFRTRVFGFRRQKIALDGARAFHGIMSSLTVRCVVCAREFAPQFAYQVAVLDGGRRYFCALDCRKAALGDAAFGGAAPRAPGRHPQSEGRHRQDHDGGQPRRRHRRPRLRHAAHRHRRAGQRRHLARHPRRAHALPPARRRRARTPKTCIVPVRGHLDVITADATLAMAEIFLARLDDARDRVLAESWPGPARRYQYIVLDCGPSLSLLNQNALSLRRRGAHPGDLRLPRARRRQAGAADAQGHRQAPRPHGAHLRRGADVLRRAHAAGARGGRHAAAATSRSGCTSRSAARRAWPRRRAIARPSSSTRPTRRAPRTIAASSRATSPAPPAPVPQPRPEAA